MTCEVAVMNKRGIALAADSAVTLGEGEKIYHTAEKLFSLSPAVPVAIMTYGAADMMGVPWETVIKIYAEKLGSRRFARLDQYATDFLSFIEEAAGRLRYVQADDLRVGSDIGARVEPFAQRELIDMIINGIHPRLQKKLVDEVERWIPDTEVIEKGAKKPKTAKAKGIDERKEEFEKYFHDEIECYEQPFMEAVAALPRQDLAKMAEALVSLTVFRMRMSVDQTETVAEPIDVAVLSKGDGFIWIKRKNLMQRADANTLQVIFQFGPARRVGFNRHRSTTFTPRKLPRSGGGR